MFFPQFFRCETLVTSNATTTMLQEFLDYHSHVYLFNFASIRSPFLLDSPTTIPHLLFSFLPSLISPDLLFPEDKECETYYE